MAQANEGHVFQSMNQASKLVSKLLYAITHFQRLSYKGTSYKTGPMTKYVVFNVYKSFVWLTSAWNGERLISTLSEVA